MQTMSHTRVLGLLENLLGYKCIRYMDSIIWKGEKHTNTIRTYELPEKPNLIRVSINLLRYSLSKTTKERIDKLPMLLDFPSLEVTMLREESEIVAAWLALAALGQESPLPDDLLCWPSGDYAWTLAAAKVAKPARQPQ